MGQLYNRVFSQVAHWGTQEWILALIIVIGIGMICMRGITSGSKYGP